MARRRRRFFFAFFLFCAIFYLFFMRISRIATILSRLATTCPPAYELEARSYESYVLDLSIQVMQNKSEKYSRAYRRCPKVSVAELREAMGAPLNAHSATASLARAAPTGGRCARPASSRCTTRPQTRVRTPLVASGSRWLDEQHPLGRLLGPAAAVAAVGLRDSRPPPTRGSCAAMDAESAKRVSRFCDPAAWFDKRHRTRVGELTILFSSLGLVTAISTLRARSEATRPGSGL